VNRRADIWYSQIGTRLENAGLDVVVIGNPWLVNFREPLPVPRRVGIVYDAIPNRYCLTEPGKPFEFATQHLNGFRYFREHCHETLAISEAVTTDLIHLLRFHPDRVGWLPPLVPIDCLKTTSTHPPRQDVILLASPLDRRKGLAAMPGLIAAAGNKVKRVTMYGGVRCSEEELHKFFRELPQRLSVEWYPSATSATTERLFRESKLLLFPSLNEGLGLPLIEAQLRGCPAIIRDARPMRDLVVPGSKVLTDRPDEDSKMIREYLENDSFDYSALEAEARRFFDTEELPSRVFARILGSAGKEESVRHVA
jgi:glycosyltransferase involved in cell wall biosynthesis